LRALVASDAFGRRQIDTAWLDTHPDAILPPATDTAALLGAWAAAEASPRDATPFGLADGWRLSGPPAPVRVELNGETFVVDRAGQTVNDHRARRVASKP